MADSYSDKVRRMTYGEITPNKIKPGRYLCYVNGLLVPIKSASVSYGVNQIPRATVDFFPSKHLRRLGAEDRVDVVLFYLDVHYSKQPTYRLLFEGEIVTWNYSTSGEEKSVSVEALANISIYGQINYGLLNNLKRIADSQTEPQTGTANAPGIYMQASFLTEGLLVNPRDVQNDADANDDDDTVEDNAVASRTIIKRPYDLLDNVLMALAGYCNHQGTPFPGMADGRIAAVNFFSRWARKQNFINRFVACPVFDDTTSNTAGGVFPILRALSYEGLLKELHQSVLNDYADGNIRQVLDSFFKSTFYELLMLPTAACVQAELSTGKILTGAHQHTGDLIRPLRLTNYLAKPNMYFAIPPMCNVVFPSMLRSLSYTENYAKQPTRMYMSEEMIDTLFNDEDLTQYNVASRALATGYPRQAGAILDAIYRRQLHDDDTETESEYAKKLASAKNTLIWEEEFYRGPAIAYGRVPMVFSALVRMVAKAAAGERQQNEQKARDALNLYTETEYFLRRYQMRAGRLDMVFNPYIVPGFPTMIFDRKDGLHVMGYVMEVTHRLTPQGMATGATYTAGRPLLESIKQIAVDSARLGTNLHSAPPDPVDEVRNTTQFLEEATKFYKQLLYRNDQPVDADYQRPPVADFTRIFQLFDNEAQARVADGSIAHQPGGPTKQKSGKRRPSKTKAVPPTQTTTPLRPESITRQTVLRPTEAYERPFNDTGAALTTVARPICTLAEYICFRYGEKAQGKIRADGSATPEFVAWVMINWGDIIISPRGWGGQPAVPSDMKPDDVGVQENAATGAPANVYDRIYKYNAHRLPVNQIQQVSPFYEAAAQDPDSTVPVLGNTPLDQLKALHATDYQTIEAWDEVLFKYIDEVKASWLAEP